jgi:hypothetical protein
MRYLRGDAPGVRQLRPVQDLPDGVRLLGMLLRMYTLLLGGIAPEVPGSPERERKKVTAYEKTVKGEK